MSIIKLEPTAFQNYTIETSPHRLFSSGSEGIEGDVRLFADASSPDSGSSVKDMDPTFAEDKYSDQAISKAYQYAITQFRNDGTNALNSINSYLQAVNAHPRGERHNKRQEVLRYEPGARFDKNYVAKSIIKNVLFDYYTNNHAGMEWNFGNYQCYKSLRMRGSMKNFDEGIAIEPSVGTFQLKINENDTLTFSITNRTDHDIVWKFEGIASILETSYSIDSNNKVLTLITNMQLASFDPLIIRDQFNAVIAASGINHASVTVESNSESSNVMINPYFFEQIPDAQSSLVSKATVSSSEPRTASLNLRINRF